MFELLIAAARTGLIASHVGESVPDCLSDTADAHMCRRQQREESLGGKGMVREVFDSA